MSAKPAPAQPAASRSLPPFQHHRSILQEEKYLFKKREDPILHK